MQKKKTFALFERKLATLVAWYDEELQRLNETGETPIRNITLQAERIGYRGAQALLVRAKQEADNTNG